MIKVAPAGEKDAVEMRKVYAGFVAKQIEAGSEIIALEADLMSSMAMDGVARDYPQHVINCGIMEANVIGTAAGLSLTGRKPFVHTFTAFASRRCFDQLFMSLDYQRNNVKVIASDAGVTACHNGGTHMSFEDMGIVRGLAHSVVLEVTDAVMFEDVLRQLIDLEGFYWVRTIRKQAPSVYAPGSTFTIGKGNVLREGTDITLIANGIMVAEALEAARQLEQIQTLTAHTLKRVGGGAGLERTAAQQGSAGCLDALGAVGDLLLALDAAGAGDDRKVAAADLDALHVDNAVVRVELAVGLFVGLGHAAAGLHHRVCQHPAFRNGLGIADQTQNMGVAALGIVDLQAHILQFVAELAYLYLRCVLFEYDDHSVLSPLPYRVKRRGRPAPLPQLAVSNFRVLKCVTL